MFIIHLSTKQRKRKNIMYKINSYSMKINNANVTPEYFAMKQRVARLKRELRINKAGK
jgi:hypothetical protein